jgi:hypothetical protein
MTSADRVGAAKQTLQWRLRFLYEAEHPTAHRFRYGLLVFDVTTILFVVVSSFIERTPLLEAIDVFLGSVILARTNPGRGPGGGLWPRLRGGAVPRSSATMLGSSVAAIPTSGER